MQCLNQAVNCSSQEVLEAWHSLFGYDSSRSNVRCMTSKQFSTSGLNVQKSGCSRFHYGSILIKQKSAELQHDVSMRFCFETSFTCKTLCVILLYTHKNYTTNFKLYANYQQMYYNQALRFLSILKFQIVCVNQRQLTLAGHANSNSLAQNCNGDELAKCLNFNSNRIFKELETWRCLHGTRRWFHQLMQRYCISLSFVRCVYVHTLTHVFLSVRRQKQTTSFSDQKQNILRPLSHQCSAYPARITNIPSLQTEENTQKTPQRTEVTEDSSTQLLESTHFGRNHKSKNLKRRCV
ncbi:Hypothetical_protein [Hexamita inflata]|uniref:Hypothetical_protein n=1 Tax=Hexamita inflata TaxID=28002 RepID=A0AA86UL89_9EUKA|nr:Hypothetical protein HINF_LOCUS43337 [Hexamita inflata]